MIGHWISPLVICVAAAVVVVMGFDRRAKARQADALDMPWDQERVWMKRNTMVGRHPPIFVAAFVLFVVLLLIGPSHWPLY